MREHCWIPTISAAQSLPGEVDQGIRQQLCMNRNQSSAAYNSGDEGISLYAHDALLLSSQTLHLPAMGDSFSSLSSLLGPLAKLSSYHIMAYGTLIGTELYQVHALLSRSLVPG